MVKKNFSYYLYNQVTLFIAIISLLGTAFGVRNYFSNPTEDLQVKTAVFEEKMLEVNSKIQNLKDNDLHTLELKVNEINESVEDLRNNITELKTILNERLPAKK
jgi:chaperonin cofactor prefoldin